MNPPVKKRLVCFLIFLIILIAFIFIITHNQTSLSQKTISITTPRTKQLVKLSYVIDGDTIIVNGKTKVRYIGINTSELKTNVSTDECYSREALAENKKLLENKRIFLEKDVSETDKYGRLLRYVYADNIFVNDYLIRKGFAKIDTYPPDIKYSSQFKQAQQEARENKLGLWKKCLN